MTTPDSRAEQQPSLRLRTDRHLIRAHARSVRYILADVLAPAATARTERLPVNIALVLDRSGSMSGSRKFDLARDAVQQALRMLRPDDRVSLVVYDNEVDVLLASARATEETKHRAMDALSLIGPRGYTDLCSGWMRGCEQVADWISEECVSRVLLLTDGLANQGTTDRPTLARHAAELRQRGIATSTFGFGADFDEHLLRDMAEEGGGNFYFIESPTQIADLLTSELGEALEVVVRRAAVEFSMPQGADVELLSRFRHERTRDGRMRVELDDLVSLQEVQLAVRVRLPLGTTGTSALAQATFSGEGVSHPVTSTLEWNYAEHAEVDRQRRDRSVDRVIAGLYAARARLEANEANRYGQFEAARRVLEATANRIRQYAGDDVELHAIVDELDRDVPQFTEAVRSAVAQKQVVFLGHAAMKHRDADGRARKR